MRSGGRVDGDCHRGERVGRIRSSAQRQQTGKAQADRGRMRKLSLAEIQGAAIHPSVCQVQPDTDGAAASSVTVSGPSARPVWSSNSIASMVLSRGL